MLTWDLDPVFFHAPFLNLQVRYYGVIFSLNFILGLGLFVWQARRAGASLTEAMDIIWPGFLGLVVGARLGHVFFYNFDYFLSDPSWLFRVWEGGLASHGAALGLAGAIYYYSRVHHRPFWDTFDRLTFSGALGAALIRLGNFFNSEIVGRPAKVDWAIRFPRFDWQLPPDLVPPRYPTQLLEFLAGLLVLGALLLIDRLAGGEKRPRGLMSAAFLILYFSARFLVEFFKERHGPNDHWWLSKGQMLSILPILLGIALLIAAYQKARKRPKN
ncbi:MAG: prolipoprotein diacylglyceryl transferase [Deltaproteobacteria bacterium]|jgi:prolipoprotein diacylglyceryl transferase|nr:prolipoprotein diacylglyceryl transferase [Deltaproteobacteria bacterium]